MWCLLCLQAVKSLPAGVAGTVGTGLVHLCAVLPRYGCSNRSQSTWILLSNTTAVLLDWGDAMWSLERSVERELCAARCLAGGLPSALYGRAGAKRVQCLEWKEDAC